MEHTRHSSARFSGGGLCTASACNHKMCRNAGRLAEAKAAEQRRASREEEASQHRKDAHEALKAARCQPLPAPLIIAKGPTGHPKQSTISWFTSSWLATPSATPATNSASPS